MGSFASLYKDVVVFFLFVLFENIGERARASARASVKRESEREARERARRARKKNN